MKMAKLNRMVLFGIGIVAGCMGFVNQSFAGTLATPELIYEDYKVKVEKVWEKEFRYLHKMVWNEDWIDNQELEKISDDVCVVENDSSINKSKIIYLNLFWEADAHDNQTIKVLNRNGQTMKEFSNGSYFGSKHFSKYFPICLSAGNYEGAPNFIKIIDRFGETIRQSTEGWYSWIEYSNDKIMIDVETEIAAGSTRYFIYDKSNNKKEVNYLPEDKCNDLTNFKVSKNGQYVLGTSGESQPEIVLWNSEGEMMWKKKMEFKKHSSSYSAISPNGKYIFAYYSRLEEPVFMILTDNQGDIIRKIELRSKGYCEFFFSEDEKDFGFIHFAKQGIDIYLYHEESGNVIERNITTGIDEIKKLRMSEKDLGSIIDQKNKNIFLIYKEHENEIKVNILRINIK